MVMKILIRSAVVTIVAMISTGASHGQCWQLQTILEHCEDPATGCMQAVPINQAMFTDEYGWYLGMFEVHCCNQVFYSQTEETGCDGERAPRIPGRALASEVSLQPLLIRNCAGGYDPYFGRPAVDFDVQKSLNSHSKIALN